MTRYFRIQETGISFEEMQNYNSLDADPESDTGWTESEGLCVSDRPDEFGGAWSAYDDEDGEVVILEGRVISQIYDGWRIYPTREIARFSKGEWRKMLADSSAWDYQ